MLGNVSQWAMDRYDPYSADTQADPTGDSSNVERVLRGGDFLDPPPVVRVSSRGGGFPSDIYEAIGVRCVLTCSLLGLPGFEDGARCGVRSCFLDRSVLSTKPHPQRRFSADYARGSEPSRSFNDSSARRRGVSK